MLFYFIFCLITVVSGVLEVNSFYIIPFIPLTSLTVTNLIFFFNVCTADSANENFRSTIFKLLVLYTYVLYILYVSQLKGISCKFVAEKWSIFLVGKTNLKRYLQTLLHHC